MAILGFFVGLRQFDCHFALPWQGVGVLFEDVEGVVPVEQFGVVGREVFCEIFLSGF